MLKSIVPPQRTSLKRTRKQRIIGIALLLVGGACIGAAAAFLATAALCKGVDCSFPFEVPIFGGIGILLFLIGIYLAYGSEAGSNGPVIH